MLLYNWQFKNIYITEVNLKMLEEFVYVDNPHLKKKHLKNTHFKIELILSVFSLSGKKLIKQYHQAMLSLGQENSQSI